MASSSPAPRTVAIFDPRPLVAEGISALLATSEDIDVVGATSEQNTVLRMVADDGAQVVLFGVDGGQSDQVVELAASLTHAADLAGRRVGLVCVMPGGSAHLDRQSTMHLPLVVTSGVSVEGLHDAIDAAFVSRGTTTPPRYRAADATGEAGRSATTLTSRERDVLQHLSSGMSTREIALRLGITANTVRTHVQHLMPKLGVHTRLQAAALAENYLAPSRSGNGSNNGTNVPVRSSHGRAR